MTKIKWIMTYLKNEWRAIAATLKYEIPIILCDPQVHRIHIRIKYGWCNHKMRRWETHNNYW